MVSKGTRYTEEQIIRILKEVASETTVAEAGALWARQYAVAEQRYIGGAASIVHRSQ